LNTEKLHILNLPSTIIDRVWDHISQYTVGLSRITRDGNKESFRLIGTGTLVIVGGLYCVLTADHVLAEIRSYDQLGLLTSFTGELRRHAFPFLHLGIHRIARGQDDSSGPDIGIISLPQASIGSLRSEKTFFNIDKRRDRFANGFLQKDHGFWFVSGIIGESEQVRGSARGFDLVKGYQALCGIAANPEEYEQGGFDYVEMQVDYKQANAELPASFGGCSGGGIWQVPLRKNKDGYIQEEEHILSGVAFHQTAIDEGIRRLKCHGRKSVYVKVPEYVDQIKSPQF
jgi:hypothetical protein